MHAAARHGPPASDAPRTATPERGASMRASRGTSIGRRRQPRCAPRVSSVLAGALVDLAVGRHQRTTQRKPKAIRNGHELTRILRACRLNWWAHGGWQRKSGRRATRAKRYGTVSCLLGIGSPRYYKWIVEIHRNGPELTVYGYELTYNLPHTPNLPADAAPRSRPHPGQR